MIYYVKRGQINSKCYKKEINKSRIIQAAISEGGKDRELSD